MKTVNQGIWTSAPENIMKGVEDTCFSSKKGPLNGVEGRNVYSGCTIEGTMLQGFLKPEKLLKCV